MMELGDQQIYCFPDFNDGSPAKVYFEYLGIKRHVSIDLNGMLGALPLDLSKPIDDPAFMGAFDMVTDLGTSEHVSPHVSGLYACRLNCHNWCREGGVMVFENPKTGNWSKHGHHYFTTEHYRLLSEACDYDVLDLADVPPVYFSDFLGHSPDRVEVIAVLRKLSGKPFVSFERYEQICSSTVFRS